MGTKQKTININQQKQQYFNFLDINRLQTFLEKKLDIEINSVQFKAVFNNADFKKYYLRDISTTIICYLYENTEVIDESPIYKEKELQELIKLPDYKLLEELGVDSRATVYYINKVSITGRPLNRGAHILIQDLSDLQLEKVIGKEDEFFELLTKEKNYRDEIQEKNS